MEFNNLWNFTLCKNQSLKILKLLLKEKKSYKEFGDFFHKKNRTKIRAAHFLKNNFY